jgi:hypothetical protein
VKPHELFDLTNRLMADLPPGVTEDELKEIGCSFIARARFLGAVRNATMRAYLLHIIESAAKGASSDAPVDPLTGPWDGSR